MEPLAVGYLVGRVMGATLIPIVVFMIVRNLLDLTPLRRKISVTHGISGAIALFLAFANAATPGGILFAILAVVATSLFIWRSYRTARMAKK